jgi:hypothetical protein
VRQEFFLSVRPQHLGLVDHLMTVHRPALPAVAFLPSGTFSTRMDIRRRRDGVGDLPLAYRTTLGALRITAVWAHRTLRSRSSDDCPVLDESSTFSFLCSEQSLASLIRTRREYPLECRANNRLTYHGCSVVLRGLPYN